MTEASGAVLERGEEVTGTLVTVTEPATVEVLDGTGMYRPLGLALKKGLPYEEWEQIGVTLEDIREGVNWWVGDWLNYGDAEYGEKYTQAVQHTGKAVQTLMNMAFVAKAIPISRRRETLSFSIHAEVAGLTARQQNAVLDEAEKENWTRDEVRRRVREIKPTLSSGKKDELPALPSGTGPNVSSDSAPETPNSVNPTPTPSEGGIGDSGSSQTPSSGNGEDVGEPPADARDLVDTVDAITEWEKAVARVAELEALVETLQVDDKTVEIVKLTNRVEGLEGRLREAQVERNEAVKRVTAQDKVLSKLRKMFSVETNQAMVKEVEALRRKLG